MTRSALLLAAGKAPFATAWALPRLLHRSGLRVEVITTATQHLKSRRYLDRLTVAADIDQVLAAGLARTAPGGDKPWVIVANDGLLCELRQRTDLATADRLRLAPVLTAEDVEHLQSKTALSQRLAAHGIATPAFRPAMSVAQAAAAGQELGFPVMIKGDIGGGGQAVRLVRSPRDLPAAFLGIGQSRVVVQQVVRGRVVDLSGIFLARHPVHFTYSELLQDPEHFGPSRVRRYYPSSAHPELLDELRTLGRALGLNGFTNITAIEPADGSARQYFEADVRPNVWAGVGAPVGDDPEVRLRHWLSTGESASGESTCVRPAQEFVVSYLRRSRRRNLFVNRNNPWHGFDATNPNAWLIAGWTLAGGRG